MSKTYLTLQESEGIVVHAASRIYAAYIAAGRVAEGQETEWMERAIREAIQIAETADAAIISDDEVDSSEEETGRVLPRSGKFGRSGQ